MVALANSRLAALSSGRRYGPAINNICNISGGTGSLLGPACVVTGNYDYCCTLDTAGSDYMVVVEKSTGQFTGYAFVSNTLKLANTHCNPCSIITPGGSLFTCYTHWPSTDRHIYYRRSTDTSPDNYAAEQTMIASVGDFVNYTGILVDSSTNNLYILTQPSVSYIAAFQSTDDGQTWTYLGKLLDASSTGLLLYWGANWASPGVLRIFPELVYYDGVTKTQSSVHCMEWTVATGDLRSGSGSIGTIGSSVPVLSATSTIWTPTSGCGLARPIIFDDANGMVNTEINLTTGVSSAWYASFTGANQYSASDWTKTMIVQSAPANDLVTDPQPRFGFDSMGYYGGKPKVYLAGTPDNLTWWIRVYAASDTAGTSWSLEKTILSGGNMTTQVVHSPCAPDPSSGQLGFYAYGPFNDYRDWSTSVYWSTFT